MVLLEAREQEMGNEINGFFFGRRQVSCIVIVMLEERGIEGRMSIMLLMVGHVLCQVWELGNGLIVCNR